LKLARHHPVYRDPLRLFAIPIGCVGRLRSDHDLLDIAADPDVWQADLSRMTKSVHRVTSTGCKPRSASAKIGREQKSHISCLVFERSITSSGHARSRQRRFADMPVVDLTGRLRPSGTGHAVSISIRHRKAETPTEDRWRKPGGAITPASSIRPG